MADIVADNAIVLPQHVPPPTPLDLDVSNRQLQAANNENAKAPSPHPLPIPQLNTLPNQDQSHLADQCILVHFLALAVVHP